MNQAKLNELIKGKIISIPLFTLNIFREFNLSIDEFTLLLFLYDKDEEPFDPNLLSKNLKMDLINVMELVSSLTDKGLISVITKKNGNGIMEEVFDLSPLYEKISLKVIEELNQKSDSKINIYEIIKQEFNRELTPLECELVDEWKKNNYSDELIKEAVREATLNGVSSLRYIDKILIEWQKKGYKSPKDIKKNPENTEKVEIFNCDWLNDSE